MSIFLHSYMRADTLPTIRIDNSRESDHESRALVDGNTGRSNYLLHQIFQRGKHMEKIRVVYIYGPLCDKLPVARECAGGMRSTNVKSKH